MSWKILGGTLIYVHGFFWKIFPKEFLSQYKNEFGEETPESLT